MQERKVPSEVRAETKATMRNVTLSASEEWIWENGGREPGGPLRRRKVERRPEPLLTLTMRMHPFRYPLVSLTRQVIKIADIKIT